MRKFMLSLCSLVLFTSVSIAEEWHVESYTYVLQAENLAPTRATVVNTLTTCGRDVIIIDAAFTEGDTGRWTPAEIAAMRAGKPGRKIICYLPIGEAENYRPYWLPSWNETPPTFLGPENPDWPGNYKVRYWDAAWQKIILAELQRILAQGFDGIMMDIIDGFEFYEQDGETCIDYRVNPETKNTYRQDMVNFVITLANAARKENSSFLIIPQNGCQLLEIPAYRKTVSAQALESLFTDGDKHQPQEHTAYIMEFLRPAIAAKRPIMLTEYAQSAQAKAYSQRKATATGVTLLLTTRPLDTLGEANQNARMKSEAKPDIKPSDAKSTAQDNTTKKQPAPNPSAKNSAHKTTSEHVSSTATSPAQITSGEESSLESSHARMRSEK